MSSVQDVDLRVGDAEREACAERLRDAYADGRLTHDELTDRLATCMAARRQAELDPLVADLPAPRPPAPRHPRLAAWRPWASVSVIVWGIWAVGVATGSGEQGLWPLWVSGPWGAVLLSHAVRGDHQHHRRHPHSA